MINISFDSGNNEGLHLLCLGAHCDDIEIGCGGTILKLIEEQKIRKVDWIVFTSNNERKIEAEKGAGMFLEAVFDKNVQILDFKDSYLPSVWIEVKAFFENLKKDTNPDLIFTHYRHDLHQDHRIINELTWNTFRNHQILEYEIPKYDGDVGNPNIFCTLDDEVVEKKVQILNECYLTQRKKHWFDTGLLKSIMRIRGMECVSKSGYAEAFYARKSVF